MDQNVLVGGLFVFVIGVIIYFRKKKDAEAATRVEETVVTDAATPDRVAEVQARFETNLDKYNDVPDSVRREDAYIYRNLMKGVYAELAGRFRYEKEMSAKINSDWLDYISLLEEKSRLNCLASMALDKDNSVEAEQLWDQQNAAKLKKAMIEDSFVSLVGGDQIAKLRDLRNVGPDQFNKLGTLIAPEGSWYLGNDLMVKSKK